MGGVAGKGLSQVAVLATGGEPAGSPVLLIHSFPSSSERDWAGWPAALNGHGRDVCLVDLPAHGRGATPRSMSAVTTGRIVEELAGAARALGGDDGDAVDVVGYSLGARLAWELPRVCRVGRLVLGGIGPKDPFAAARTSELLEFASTGRRAEDRYTDHLIDLVAQPGLDSRGLALVIAGLASEPFRPARESAPRVPTLFVVGEQDFMMQDGLDEVIALVPGASLVTVPGDHRGGLLSAEFRDAALRFLEGTTAGAC